MVRRRTDGVHPIVRRGDPPENGDATCRPGSCGCLVPRPPSPRSAGPRRNTRTCGNGRQGTRHLPPTSPKFRKRPLPQPAPSLSGCRGQPRSVGRTCTWTRLPTGSSKVHHRGDVMGSAERHRPREMPEPPGDPPTGENVPHAPAATRTPRGAGRVRHPAHLHPDVRLRRAGFSP